MTRLKCFFSFRSPFAAIALYRLRRAKEFADIDIELMPLWPEVVFGGHMDNPSDSLFKMAYIFTDAARQAELAGLNRDTFDALAKHFSLPKGADYRQAKTGVPMGEEHWDRTHKAFLHALNEGKGWEFADKTCIRRFNFDGQGAVDVMNDEVIKSIATSCGLDGNAAISAIDDPAINRQMDEVICESNDLGVFGVPFFVLEQNSKTERFWGNDRLEYVLKQIDGLKALPMIMPVTLDTVCR